MNNKQVQCYNSMWPADMPQLQMEMICYLKWHDTIEDGKRLTRSGHLQWEHLKMMMILGEPDTYGEKGEKWHSAVEDMVYLFCTYHVVIVMGAANQGKTHDIARIMFWDWMADPTNTRTTLTTVTLPALSTRMWAEVVKVARVDPNLKVNNYKYTITTPIHTSDQCALVGIATSKDKDAAGRIAGGHAPRVRVAIDEAQFTAKAIFDTMDNLMAAHDFRAIIPGNPFDRETEFGKLCEPKGGWDDPAYGGRFWLTKKGRPGKPFACLHLSAFDCENVKAGKRIHPWQVDREYIETVRINSGENSANWYAYVLGLFPPDGTVNKVFVRAVLQRARQTINFVGRTWTCASLDPAYGGDECILTFARYGSIEKGQIGLQWEGDINIPIDASDPSITAEEQIAKRVKNECIDRGVAPGDFIMDCTGNGRGTYAALIRDWFPDIQWCEFGGKPSKRVLRQGDERTCEELYPYFVDELWYATREWMAAGLLGGLDEPDANKDGGLVAQLSARLPAALSSSRRAGGRDALETKLEFKTRMGYSPDRADSFTMLVELMRRKGALCGKMSDFQGGTRSHALAEMAKRHEVYDKKDEFLHEEPLEPVEANYYGSGFGDGE